MTAIGLPAIALPPHAGSLAPYPRMGQMQAYRQEALTQSPPIDARAKMYYSILLSNTKPRTLILDPIKQPHTHLEERMRTSMLEIKARTTLHRLQA